jgi:hypothetical protein
MRFSEVFGVDKNKSTGRYTIGLCLKTSDTSEEIPMPKVLFSLLATCLLLAALPVTAAQTPTQTPAPDKNLRLSAPQDMADALAISLAMDQVSAQVNICVEKKLAVPQKCFCRYPKQLKQLKSKYQQALKHHPDWKDKTLTWQGSNPPMGYTLILESLRKQLAIKCP